MSNPYQPGDLRHTLVAMVDGLALLGRIRNEREQHRRWLDVARPRCGNCRLWMTDACPAERHDNMSGRKRGPSMNGTACAKFSETSNVQEYRDKAEAHRLEAERLSTPPARQEAP